jgi:glyoxylase-like metal-dependent hydrolase (beta-lactamase superfamily II)
VWAALVVRRPAAYAFANSLVVESPEGVLVVDTQQSPEAARALLELVRARTDAPVRWVVNTHWHGDHVNGNQVYRDAFPDVHFVAHVATREEMLTTGRADREEEISNLPTSIEARRGWLATGRGPDGSELTPDQLDAVRYSVELREAYLGELRSLRETPPDVTFRDRLRLRLGRRTVVLRHLGPAHTRGDIVVQVPGSGVVAVGDLLEEGPLWLEGADVPGWASALSELAKLDARVFLPSHGGVQRDDGLLRLQASFLGSAVATARRARAAGRSEKETVAEAVDRLERFRSRLAGLGLDGEAFEEHARSAVVEAYRDLEGG